MENFHMADIWDAYKVKQRLDGLDASAVRNTGLVISQVSCHISVHMLHVMLLVALHQVVVALRHPLLCFLQELGYMSRRGHEFGVISTYFTTWVLKTDGKGILWISPGIDRAADASNSTEVTVTQVCYASAFCLSYSHGVRCCLLSGVQLHAAQHCAAACIVCLVFVPDMFLIQCCGVHLNRLSFSLQWATSTSAATLRCRTAQLKSRGKNLCLLRREQPR